MIFEQDRVAVTPFEQGLRVGSTMELSGYDTSMKAHRLKPLQIAERFYLNQIDWDGDAAAVVGLAAADPRRQTVH